MLLMPGEGVGRGSERRIGGLSIGGIGWWSWSGAHVRIAQELSGVVTLESVGEFVQELDELGGGLIRQIQGQAHDRQIVRFHGELLQRVFLPAGRCGARRAACSWASLSR